MSLFVYFFSIFSHLNKETTDFKYRLYKIFWILRQCFSIFFYFFNLRVQNVPFSKAWFLSCELECSFKNSKWLPHYTLAVFGAYLCFFLAEPDTSSSLFSDWLSPSSVFQAALGIVLTSGCATSRHCQQQELPGVRIHCCDSDLCNSSPSWHPSTLHYICALFSLLLLRMWLWYGVILERNITPVDYGRNILYEKLSSILFAAHVSCWMRVLLSMVLLVSTLK